MPKRIQLKRVKGWRLPEGAVNVARPTKWGNPFTVKSAIHHGFAQNEDQARKLVVECFADWLSKGESSDWWFADGAKQHAWMCDNIRTLRGKDLACWCKTEPCHATVLMAAANF